MRLHTALCLYRFRRNLRRRIRGERLENVRLRKALAEAVEQAGSATAKCADAEDRLKAVRADLSSLLDERLSMGERLDEGSRG